VKLTFLRKTDLAVRALRHLAEDGRIRSGDLAAAIGSTATFIPQVMAPLITAGFVDSSRGPTGGYRLARPLETIRFLDVVEAVEGPVEDGTCVLRGGACRDQGPCALHEVWTRARDALAAELAATTLKPERRET
jgi:Rrf2 family iron-sulfur cluster assembly transcriptional regulator